MSTSLNMLPTEIENMILDYKTTMENHGNAIDYVKQCAMNIEEDIFTRTDNKYNIYKNDINLYCQENFNFQLCNEEIYNNTIKTISKDNRYIFDWYSIGSGSNIFEHDIEDDFEFKTLYELPIEFVKEFQDEIDWRFVLGQNTERFPIEFVREFRHRIELPEPTFTTLFEEFTGFSIGKKSFSVKCDDLLDQVFDYLW